MIKISEKQYCDIVKKVGPEKMAAVEQASGVTPQDSLTETPKYVSRQKTDIAEEINALHTDIDGMAKTTVDKAIRIGELLCKQKEFVGHGRFEHWIKQNINFSIRNAQNYMTVYAQREKLKNTKYASLSDAYKVIGILKTNSDKAIGKPTPLCSAANKIQSDTTNSCDRMFVVTEIRKGTLRYHLFTKRVTSDAVVVERKSYKVLKAETIDHNTKIYEIELFQESDSDTDKYDLYTQKVQEIKDNQEKHQKALELDKTFDIAVA